MTVEEALAHPTWSMGPKITIDSATLANKGLELIEAHYLFGIDYDRIEVVVHPTSVVHALVRFRDGASLAHLGYPDMRVPISFALTYPERRATPVSAVSTSPPVSRSSSRRPTPSASRCSRSPARRASAAGPTRARSTRRTRSRSPRSSTAASASREIAALVEDALAAVDGAPARDLDELVEADEQARRLATGRLTSAA